MNYVAPMPMPSAPLVEPDSGLITDAWWQWMLSMFARTGGAQGVGSADLQKAITAGGAASSTGAAVLTWPSANSAVVANGTYELVLAWPWQTGAIIKLTTETGCGSFTVALLKNTAAVPGLSGVLVNSQTPVTTAATTNSLVAGDTLVLAVSGATTGPGGFSTDFTSNFASAALAAPTDATIQVAYTRSPS